MLKILYLLIPSLLLMLIRDKIFSKGGKAKKDIGDYIQKYIITTVILNSLIIAFISLYNIIIKSESLFASFNQQKNINVYYFIGAIIIACIEPIIEKVVRGKFNIDFSRFDNTCYKSILLYGYTFIMFLLNFIRIFDNAFWGDEGFTMRLAKMSLSEMINTTAADMHPPLYYLLTQLLYKIFGDSGFSYHLSALIPYAGILIIACVVVKKKFGFIPAFILVTMSSIMKRAVTYNVEVRMYSMGAFFVLLSFLALYNIIKNNNKKDWIIFCIVSLCAAFTHYYALISVAFFYVTLLILMFKNKKYMKPTIITSIVTILVYLPWLSKLVDAFERTVEQWWLEDIPGVGSIVGFIFDYIWIVLMFIIVVGIYALYQLKNNSNNKEKKVSISDELIWIISGLSSVLGTIVVGLGLSYGIRPFFVTRYLFPITPVVYLIFGYCISKYKMKNTLSIAIIFGILWCNIPAYVKTYNNEKLLDTETKQALDIVKPSNEAAIFSDNSMLWRSVLGHYYPNNYRAYSEDAVKETENDYKEIWLFWRSELDNEQQEKIRNNGYELNEVYVGRFADGGTYHIYGLLEE